MNNIDKPVNVLVVTLIAIVCLLLSIGYMQTSEITSLKDTHAVEVSEHTRSVAQVDAVNKNLVQVVDMFTHGDPLLITAYNAHESQTDDTPLITASNGTVKVGNMALSRDFLKRFDPKNDVAFGDSVWLIIHMKVDDTMNKRYLHRGDIFMWSYSDAVAFGVKEGYVNTR
jgi:3D (Asp-Asp-Asp) domain-containing protein